MNTLVLKKFQAKSSLKQFSAEKFKKSLKKGSRLYSVCCWHNDDDSANVELDELMITSIRYAKGDAKFKHNPIVRRTVFYVELIDYVTCRLKKDKVELFDSISPTFKHSFKEGDDLPESRYTSKVKACDYAIRDAEIQIELYGKKIKEIVKNDGKPVCYRNETEQDCMAKIKFLKNSITKIKSLRTRVSKTA